MFGCRAEFRWPEEPSYVPILSPDARLLQDAQDAASPPPKALLRCSVWTLGDSSLRGGVNDNVGSLR